MNPLICPDRDFVVQFTLRISLSSVYDGSSFSFCVRSMNDVYVACFLQSNHFEIDNRVKCNCKSNSNSFYSFVCTIFSHELLTLTYDLEIFPLRPQLGWRFELGLYLTLLLVELSYVEC